MLASILTTLLLPSSPLSLQEDPALTIVRDTTLPKDLTEAWEASSDRRWLPNPQDAPYQFYAQQVFKERWRIMGAVEAQRTGAEIVAKDLGFHFGTMNEVPVAWTANQDQIRFDQDANTVMAAWGYDFYGKYYHQSAWSTRSHQMADLWTYSPLDPTVFSTETKEFTASDDTRGPAFSGFWAIQRLELHPEQEAPDLVHRLTLLAAKPTTSPAQALFQSAALTTNALPEASKENLADYLEAYDWPSPTEVKSTELPILVWALASEYRRTQNPALKDALLNASIALSRKQSTADNPDLPSQPSFGTVSLDDAVHSNNAPYAAAALCEAGAALQNTQLMQRGVAAIRASFGQLRTGFNSIVPPFHPDLYGYQAYSAYGKDGDDLYEPWTSFEACEGKILAVTGYLTKRFGALYEIKPGEWVGIDSIRMDGDERVDLLRNLPNPFQRPQPYRELVAFNGERKPLPTSLGRKQVIVDMLLVSIDPQPVVRVLTGSSVTGADVYGENNPLSVALNLPNGAITPTIDQTGFSAPVDPSQINRKLTGVLKLSEWSYSRSFPIFDTPPVAANKVGSEGWTRFGQTTKLPVPGRAGDWISTGRLTNDLFAAASIGMVQSPAFFGKNRILSFSVQGQGGALFQLVNPDSGEVFVDFEATEMEPTNIEWDLSFYPNRRLQLRLLDTKTNGFVELKNLKFSNPEK